MKNFTKYSALATTTLLIVGLAGPANADTKRPTDLPKEPTETGQVAIQAVKTSLHYERPAVTTTPAPQVVEPVQAASTQSVAVEAQPTAPTTSTPTQRTAPSAPAPTPVAAPPAVPSSGKGAALVASAYSQIGITQDCTRMVENALASIGIISGDLAPAQFFQFGSVVGTPEPGDILISAGHVGIYVGNGQMISGGFNGSQTVLHPVSYVGAYSAVRVA